MKWSQLILNTRKISPTSIRNAAGSSSISLSKEPQYDPSSKTIRFDLEARGTRDEYPLIIEFINIRDNQNLSDNEITSGYIPRPSLKKNDIKIDCFCTSYRFTCDYANRLHGVGTGPNFSTYRKKTDRESRNPNNVPCACKHIISAISFLLDNNIVVN